MGDSNLTQAIKRSLEVAARIRRDEQALAKALKSGDSDAIERAARALLGMDEREEEGDCASQSVRRRASGE